MKTKLAAVLAGAALMMSAGSASAESTLQEIFNNFTVGPVAGVSSVNAETDMLADLTDSYWNITASGGSVATMIIEIAGNSTSNNLYVYDSANYLNKVMLFSGSATAGSQALLSIKDDGSVFVNFADSGIDFSGNSFGYALVGNGYTYYSDSSLNNNNADYMQAFQGTNTDTIKLPTLAKGLWTDNEYILAFEDGTDFDFNDMVVMVESVAPVPEPGTFALLGAGLLGLALYRRRVQQN